MQVHIDLLLDPRERSLMSMFRFTKKNKLLVLRRMREIVARPRGWVKHRLYTSGAVAGRDYSAYCLLGAEFKAIADVTGMNIWDAEKIDPSGQRISTWKGARARGFNSVPQFNDDSKTRKKDVIALIDEKIAELEGA